MPSLISSMVVVLVCHAPVAFNRGAIRSIRTERSSAVRRRPAAYAQYMPGSDVAVERAHRPRAAPRSSLPIAARTARVTLSRARSAAEAARRSRPPSPNAAASWATSWSSSSCDRLGALEHPGLDRVVGLRTQRLDPVPIGRARLAVEQLAGVAERRGDRRPSGSTPSTRSTRSSAWRSTPALAIRSAR